MIRLFSLLLCLFVAIPPAAAALSAKAVRIGVHADKTRFVLELSAEPSYRVFTLPDPVRVVIDLPELEWQLDSDQIPASKGMIETLRYGLFAQGTSRVVLDMKGPVGVKSVLVLPPQGGSGYRLVVDLHAISRDVFLNPDEREPVVSKNPLPKPRPVALPVVPPKPKSDERPTVVIDAGHGGVDPGAIGLSGIHEKTLVLDYARELARQLKASGRYRVVLTRDKDLFLRLRDRMLVAQRATADLFISLHANTVEQRHVRGASVYTLSEKASDAEAAALAQKENTADIIAGVNFDAQTEDVNMILIDLAQRETMNLSKKFANIMVTEIGKSTKLLRNTHRFAGFAVLKSPTVPSVLVEIGYMSNKQEEKLMQTKGHRVKISKAIIRAIDNYFNWQEALRRS